MKTLCWKIINSADYAELITKTFRFVPTVNEKLRFSEARNKTTKKQWNIQMFSSLNLFFIASFVEQEIKRNAYYEQRARLFSILSKIAS